MSVPIAPEIPAKVPDIGSTFLLRVVSIWILVLLLVVYGQTLVGIAGSWFDENADMGHGLAVPLVASYMVWMKRSRLAALPTACNVVGLVVVLLGALQFIVSSAADWVFAGRMAFLVSLVGSLLAIWGWRVVRELAYPLGILVWMIAPPTFLQAKLTLPLQLLASNLAERALDGLGYSVLREGNILEMVGERLSVAQACSGIRALMSLFFFCLTYNYFLVRERAIRRILLVAVVPVALLTNAGRIVATGVIGQYDRELAHGIMHENLGYLSILIAGALLVGFCLVLERSLEILRRRDANV